MIRFLILVAAFWCAAFALAHIIQMMVLSAPADMQPILTRYWALQASIAAPLAAIFYQAGKKP